MFNFWKASSTDAQDASQAAVNGTDAQPESVGASPGITSPEQTVEGSEKHAEGQVAQVSKEVDSKDQQPLPPVDSSESRIAFPRPSTSTEVYVSEVQMVPASVTGVDITGAALLSPSPDAPPARRRRISFRSFGFFYGKERQTSSTVIKTTGPEEPNAPVAQKIKSKREARKAEKAALVLQSFLLGYTPSFPSFLSGPATSPQDASNGKPSKGKGKAGVNGQLKPPSASKLGKANNQLLSPDQANKVIAKLRTLPVPNGPELPGVEYAGEHVVSHAEGPIHAVCLDCTDEEAELYHFSQLSAGPETSSKKSKQPAQFSEAPSIASANLSSLVPVLRSLHLVTLVSSPDLGFGQPPDGDGPLAGSVPSPAAVNNGMMEITSQLLALGFATSKAVFPEHAGVYPPTDRMSVLTYWWGMEVCLPPPTLQFLANVKSIQNSALNLLTAYSLFNNGVREILPFVRYISQFLDFEWSAIQGQNKGKGVVCAATWVCPAALVPRPWDFADPPEGQGIFIPKALPPPPLDNEPTLIVPGSKGGGIFTPNNPSTPHVMITPATLPRGAKMEMLRT